MSLPDYVPEPEGDPYDEIEMVPQFSMTVFDEPDFKVDRTIALPTHTDERPASMSLIYGLAVMTLDQDGTIQRRMLELIQANSEITQKAACESIQLLLMEEHNDALI